MIKQTVTYKDFNGDEQTDDLYFNLTPEEVVSLQFSAKGGLDVVLDKIIKTDDTVKLMPLFKSIVDIAHGERSADGKNFYKDEQTLREFKSSGAYSELIVMLVTDPKIATEFTNGIMPEGLEKIAEKAEKGARELSEKGLQGYLGKQAVKDYSPSTTEKVEDTQDIKNEEARAERLRKYNEAREAKNEE